MELLYYSGFMCCAWLYCFDKDGVGKAWQFLINMGAWLGGFFCLKCAILQITGAHL